jgi:hypothetical protein
VSDERETAARYRRQAEEVRRLARGLEHLPYRQALLDIADTYERMARELDDIGESNKK